MNNRLMIDMLKNNNQINDIIESETIVYEFCSVLYYIKEKYDISVVDLGLILDVTRQTIYNYFQLHSKDLPETIKNQIAMIYGEISFEEVINKELLVEYESIKILPLLYNSMTPEGYFTASMGISNVKQISKVYEEAFYVDSQPEGYIKLKANYNFAFMWKNYIKEIKNPKKYSNENDRILNDIKELQKIHSKEYLHLLLKVIQDKVCKDDDEFFIYLTNYKGGGKE